MDTSVPPRPKSFRKENYFNKQLTVLRYVGVSVFDDEGTVYKIYSAIAVFSTIFLYSFLDSFEYFKQDGAGISDMIMYQVGGTMSAIKVTVIYLNRYKLVKLLTKLHQEPFLPNRKRGGSNKEEELINECIWITNVQTYVYWITCFITIIGTIIFVFIKHYLSNTKDYKLVYGPFTIVNVTENNYEIVYLYQSVSIVYISTAFTAVDLLLAAILAHLCYQFRILQNSIRRLMVSCYEEMKEHESGFKEKQIQDTNFEYDGANIPWIYLKKCIKEAIEYHLALTDMAAQIEEVVSTLFLLVFLGTLALICSSIYSAASLNIQVAIRHLGEAVCSALQVATVCYWGEQVMYESEQVGRAAYESNFVGTDLRYQKMLVLIIRRSQNPTKFTAGKFSVICLATFTWILRTSYSSFMVIRKSNGE